MSLLSRLFGLADPNAEPKSYPSRVFRFGKQRTYFDSDNKDQLKCRRMYEQGGMVGEAIDCYPLFTLTNGYRLEGDDEKLAETVQEWYDKVDMETVLHQLIVDALVIGKGYAEIVYNRAGNAIVGLLPRPAETFSENLDQMGNVISYTQTVQRNHETDKVEFAPEQIFVLDLHLPLIQRAMRDIETDAAVADATAVSIQRHGFPRYHVRLGQPGESIPEQTLREHGRQFESIKPNNEWTTTKDVEILNIDTQGAVNTKLYGDWAVQRVCSALGVPEEMLGLGRGSTEATANVRLQAFYDKIGSIQKRVARALGSLNDKLTGRPGSVWTEFNDVSPVDEGMKADYVVKLHQAVPGDPYAIVTPTWTRDYLGVEIALDDPDNPLNPENQAPEPPPILPPVIIAPPQDQQQGGKA